MSGGSSMVRTAGEACRVCPTLGVVRRAGPAAQRALPAQNGQQRGGGGGAAGRQRGQQAEGGAADRRREGPVQFGAERGTDLALAVGGTGEPADPGGGQPA
ncbi:hypothetical protein UK12_33205, partial [Saccharothrix sp. ST-888]